MKGKLLKADGKWLVSYNDSQGIFKLLPLHPFDVQMIADQEKIFDNIEARISAYPDVEFGIENFWETGIEEPFETALLIRDDEDWDVTLNDGLEDL
jgi:hypothetical protein